MSIINATKIGNVEISEFLEIEVCIPCLEIDIEDLNEVNNKLLLIENLSCAKQQKLFKYLEFMDGSDVCKLSKIEEAIDDLGNYVFTDSKELKSKYCSVDVFGQYSDYGVYITLPCSNEEIEEFLTETSDVEIEFDTETTGLNIDLKNIYEVNEKITFLNEFLIRNENYLEAIYEYIKTNKINLSEIKANIIELAFKMSQKQIK